MKSFGWTGVVIGLAAAALALLPQFGAGAVAFLVAALIAAVLGMWGVVVGSDSLEVTTRRGLYAAAVAAGLVAGAAGWRFGSFWTGVLVGFLVYGLLLAGLVALKERREGRQQDAANDTP